jgi:hypothetical protein
MMLIIWCARRWCCEPAVFRRTHLPVAASSDYAPADNPVVAELCASTYERSSMLSWRLSYVALLSLVTDHQITVLQHMLI